MHAETEVLAIDDLCARAGTYLTDEQIEKVRRAYEFGAVAHSGQMRLSGEPYIQHPLEVANILTDMHMDHDTLVASARAYVNALNKLLVKRERGEPAAMTA